MWTGSSGRYTHWTARNNAPLDVTVSAAGYLPEHRRVNLRPKNDGAEHFTLRAIC